VSTHSCSWFDAGSEHLHIVQWQNVSKPLRSIESKPALMTYIFPEPCTIECRIRTHASQAVVHAKISPCFHVEVIQRRKMIRYSIYRCRELLQWNKQHDWRHQPLILLNWTSLNLSPTPTTLSGCHNRETLMHWSTELTYQSRRFGLVLVRSEAHSRVLSLGGGCFCHGDTSCHLCNVQSIRHADVHTAGRKVTRGCQTISYLRAATLS